MTRWRLLSAASNPFALATIVLLLTRKMLVPPVRYPGQIIPARHHAVLDVDDATWVDVDTVPGVARHHRCSGP